MKKKIIIGIVTSILLSMLFIYQKNEKDRKYNKLQELSDKYYGESVIEFKKLAYDKALINIDKALGYVKNEKNYLLRVQINQVLANIDEMISDYDNLIKINGKNNEFYNNRANLYIGKKNYEKAIKDLEKSLAINEKQSNIIKILYNIYTEQNNYERAYKWAEKLYQLDKSEENYLIYLQSGYLYQKYDQVLNDALNQYGKRANDSLALIIANCYYQKANYLQALTYYKKIEQKSSDVYLLMGYSSYLNKNYQEAKEYLLLSNSQEKDVLAIIEGCQLYLDGKNNELDKADLVNQKGEFSNDYYKYLAYEYYNQGDYHQTIKYLLLYVEKTNDVSQYFVLANCYNLVDDHDQAINYYSKSIDHNIETGNSYYNRGIIYLNKQEYLKAVIDFGESYNLNIKPDYSKYNQGIAYMNLSKFKESTQCFLKVVEISQDQELIGKAKDILSRYYVS